MSTDPFTAATTSGGPLHERLGAIAAQLSETTFEHTTKHEQVAAEPAALLSDLAVALNALARECEEEYEHAHGEGAPPTPAQGFALARFLCRGWRDGTPRGERYAHVSLGGAGLPDDYIHVRLSDGYEGGIDREGRVST